MASAGKLQEFLHGLAKQLGYKSYNEYYNLPSQYIIDSGGSKLLKQYGNVSRLVSENIKDHNWQIWKFRKVPSGYWHHKHNQRKFLEEIGEELLGKKSNEDWYSIVQDISKQKILMEYGSSLFQLYGGSFVKTITTVYKDYNWKIWKFYPYMDSKYWKDITNQRSYFNDLGNCLGIKEYWDWYQISPDVIRKNGGIQLIKYYNGDLPKTISTVYKEHDWKLWLFVHKPDHFWKGKEIQKLFLEFIKESENIKCTEDWYFVTYQNIKNNGGEELIKLYDNSLIKALIANYPELKHTLSFIWFDEKPPNGFWHKKENQTRFFDLLGKKIGIKTLKDWYSIKTSDLVEYHLERSLLNFFRGSLHDALKSAYPMFHWKRFLFTRVPANHWVREENVKDYIKWLQSELKVKESSDWRTVLISRCFRGRSLIDKYDGFLHLISKFTNERELVPIFGEKKSLLLKKSQLNLYSKIQDLFPNLDIFINYEHPQLHYTESKRSMELDIFIPSLNLAFEYQGVQHFEINNYVFVPSNISKKKDESKQKACKLLGITLIEVPYWWTGSTEVIANLIHQSRPDLISLASKLTIPTVELVQATQISTMHFK